MRRELENYSETAIVIIDTFSPEIMDTPITYCQYVAQLPPNEPNLHRDYHDKQYGFPIHSDNELFCRLILEINQAGLSWTTILKKQEAFRSAYHNFDVKKVAAYGKKDFERLMNDAGIIRNRLKINAAIQNAKAILALQQEYGSFREWLDAQHPMQLDDWVKLFRKTFRFTGREIVKEFLVSIGYLRGAHGEDCPVFKSILKAKPVWMKE